MFTVFADLHFHLCSLGKPMGKSSLEEFICVAKSYVNSLCFLRSKTLVKTLCHSRPLSPFTPCRSLARNAAQPPRAALRAAAAERNTATAPQTAMAHFGTAEQEEKVDASMLRSMGFPEADVREA